MNLCVNHVKQLGFREFTYEKQETVVRTFTFFIAFCVVSTVAVADRIVGKIEDKYVTKVRNIPVTTEQCELVRVPIYADSEKKEDQFGEMILGAAIGSVIGNKISDGDGVGTIGGIIGARIAADSSQANSREIIAYSDEERCEMVRSYEKEYVEDYSHSYITFELDGRRYRVKFTR